MINAKRILGIAGIDKGVTSTLKDLCSGQNAPLDEHETHHHETYVAVTVTDDLKRFVREEHVDPRVLGEQRAEEQCETRRQKPFENRTALRCVRGPRDYRAVDEKSSDAHQHQERAARRHDHFCVAPKNN